MGVDRDVWECYSDRPYVNEDDVFDGGCGGWGKSSTVEKWLNDVPVKTWATGDTRYIEVFEETLDYLAPILNLEFQRVGTEKEADFKAYVGIPRSEAENYGFARDSKKIVEYAGFASSNKLRGEVTNAYIVVWALKDPTWDARNRNSVKTTTVHEVLHAMAAVSHTNRQTGTSNMGGSGLKWLSPMDEALVRLNSHNSVEPGMTMPEVESLIVFSDELLDEVQAPEPDTLQIVWRATEELLGSGSARFKMRGGWTEGRCNLLFGVRRGLAVYETVFGSLRHEPPLVHFDDRTTHFYIIRDESSGEWRRWLNVSGDNWQEVDRETLQDSTRWWVWNGKLTKTLRSLLNDATADAITVIDRSNGTITLEATLDESYPTLWNWTTNKDVVVEFQLVLDDETYDLEGYTWRRVRKQPTDNCDTYEEEVSEVELGVEVEIPERIRELMSQR